MELGLPSLCIGEALTYKTFTTLFSKKLNT